MRKNRIDTIFHKFPIASVRGIEYNHEPWNRASNRVQRWAAKLEKWRRRTEIDMRKNIKCMKITKNALKPHIKW